jgi:hypothetical protein
VQAADLRRDQPGFVGGPRNVPDARLGRERLAVAFLDRFLPQHRLEKSVAETRRERVGRIIFHEGKEQRRRMMLHHRLKEIALKSGQIVKTLIEDL